MKVSLKFQIITYSVLTVAAAWILFPSEGTIDIVKGSYPIAWKVTPATHWIFLKSFLTLLIVIGCAYSLRNLKGKAS